MLIRVGAYYHDVGKSIKPEYFIENQGGGENPHNHLPPHDSARAIFNHVIEGTRLLRQEGVPEDVIEFAFTHHGTSLLEFFWHKNLADGNPLELTEKDFCYPGHKPVTREEGILRVVDAIEAAARTVDQPDKGRFEQLVQRIIFSKLSQGQLDESGLTLSDIRAASTTIIDTLVSMYHARIKYPWQSESTGASGAGTPHAGTPAVRADQTQPEAPPEPQAPRVPSPSIPPPALLEPEVEPQPAVIDAGPVAPASESVPEPPVTRPAAPSPFPVPPSPFPPADPDPTPLPPVVVVRHDPDTGSIPAPPRTTLPGQGGHDPENGD
jgi:putative nucleotidyltransferase with HDIG domain